MFRRISVAVLGFGLACSSDVGPSSLNSDESTAEPTAPLLPPAMPPDAPLPDVARFVSRTHDVADTIEYARCPEPTWACRNPDLQSEVSEADYTAVPKAIFALFQAEFDARGEDLDLDMRWRATWPGGGLLRNPGLTLLLFGGTARVPGMTLDGYRAVICHEFGHFLGGAPNQQPPLATWASAEGQADFFAAHTCLPRLFAALGTPESEIAERVRLAGYSMVFSLSGLSQADFDAGLAAPEALAPVAKTLHNQYPSNACRYETFKANTARAACWYRADS